jgi:hypothetical protein
MRTNCTALAKVTVNRKLNTYRIVFTFDHHNRISAQNIVHRTGDICDVNHANAEHYIESAIENAKLLLRCNNVEIVNNDF